MSVCLPQRCLCCHLLKCLTLGVSQGPGKHSRCLNYSKALDWILGVCVMLSSPLWKNALPAALGVLTPRYVIPECLAGSREWGEMCITVLFVVIEHVCDKYRWEDLVGVLGWRNASIFWACLTVLCFHVGLHFGKVILPYMVRSWGVAVQPHPHIFAFSLFLWMNKGEQFVLSVADPTD